MLKIGSQVRIHPKTKILIPDEKCREVRDKQLVGIIIEQEYMGELVVYTIDLLPDWAFIERELVKA